MRIPGFMLNKKVSVEPYEGETGVGPSYGDPVEIDCYREDRRRVVYDGSGSKVIAEGTLWANPEENIPVESKLTIDGRARKAITSEVLNGLTEASHIEVTYK